MSDKAKPEKFFDRLRIRSRDIGSWVCVGLDVEVAKIPGFLQPLKHPQAEFCRRIVEATSDVALCYKINMAFFEAEGLSGYHSLMETFALIPKDVPVILDAKRADIGNTSKQYARACFEEFGADAVTVNPYLGHDALEPFLEYRDRGIYVLGLTSNPGAKDFELLVCDGTPLYEHVARQVARWNTRGNCGLVVGATQADSFARLRQLVPELPFLVPGVGAQGGSIEEVVRHGPTHSGIPPVVNSSRGIIFASSGEDFAQAARTATINLRDEIRRAIKTAEQN